MLIDTSALFILALANEPQHTAAVGLFRQAQFKITHSYFIAEFVALATARGLPRNQTLDFIASLHKGSNVEIVYVDEELHQAALQLLRRRLDKAWSLCDAISFILMERRKIQEALTTDHHFAQAGFTPLLNP